MMVVGTLLVLLGLMSIVLLGLLSGGGGTSSSGMMSASDNGLVAASTVGRRIIAENLADAGAEDTILWLSAQSAPPPNAAAFAPSASSFALPLWNAATHAGSPPRAVVNYPDAAHTFSVTIYPGSGNNGGGLKSYLIESIGNDAGFTQILHVYVTQVSFTHWAWFEGNGNAGTWSSDVESFEGPTHYNTMSWGNFSLNWRDGAAPIFNYTGADAFSTGFPIYWQHNGNSVSGPPAGSDTAGWNSLSLGGPTSIKANQDQVSLPSTAAAMGVQKAAALGTLTTAPTSAIGATACPGGGLYIHGDVQQMTLSLDGFNSEIQIIELYQIDPTTHADDYTKITMSSGGPVSIQTGTFTPAGAITLNPASAWPAQVPGTMNGVIYCDGNIGSQTYPSTGGLKGVIADNNIYCGTNYHTNALTIATDPTKNIYLDGSLLVNTPRQIQQNSFAQYEFHDYHGAVVTQSSATPTPSGCVPVYVPELLDTGQFRTWAGELGLVTNNIVYGAFVMNSTGMQQTGSPYTPLTSLEIDAAQFEYGSHGGSPYSGAVPGLALLSMGANVHNNGTFFNWGACYDDSGYDTRLTSLPPPYYPATSNRYTLTSWQRVASCVQGTP